jgi:hypothetical protein
MLQLLHSIKAVRRFRDYRPQRVTFLGVNRWFNQFEKRDRKYARALLECVIFLSERDIRQILVDQNRALMNWLSAAGLPNHKLIYVQIDDAGSSSPVMLNMLRDAAGLERLGCHLLDSRDTLGISRTTNQVGEGALIYLDNFVGTGDQFCEARDFAAKYVVGTFSEFLLVPSICEEGLYKMGEVGIQPFAGHLHAKAERPLHDNSAIFDKLAKERLRLVCERIRPGAGLGYGELATMVVLYSNAPDNVPALLRGNPNQKPFAGIFPRFSDLPLEALR